MTIFLSWYNRARRFIGGSYLNAIRGMEVMTKMKIIVLKKCKAGKKIHWSMKPSKMIKMAATATGARKCYLADGSVLE